VQLLDTTKPRAGAACRFTDMPPAQVHTGPNHSCVSLPSALSASHRPACSLHALWAASCHSASTSAQQRFSPLYTAGRACRPHPPLRSPRSSRADPGYLV
jgi:hypothetical protein